MMARRKADKGKAESADNGGQVKTGLVSDGFSLELYQNWPRKASQFLLQVVTADGKNYVLQATPPDQAGLCSLLLRRIAAADCQPGWTFKAEGGIITG
jgi:hypothetical protein